MTILYQSAPPLGTCCASRALERSTRTTEPGQNWEKCPGKGVSQEKASATFSADAGAEPVVQKGISDAAAEDPGENRQFAALSDIMKTKHGTAKNALNNLK